MSTPLQSFGGRFSATSYYLDSNDFHKTLFPDFDLQVDALWKSAHYVIL